MKKLLTLLPATFLVFVCFGQDDITVCHTPSTEKFATFASNKEFKAAHAAPRAYVHISEEGGKMIQFSCSDGKSANGYLVMATKKTNNWIFVFQEWWGLNDNIKRQSEDLYKDLGNVNVLALDLYDGNIATDREQAAKYMQEFKQERGDMIIGTRTVPATTGSCFAAAQTMGIAGKRHSLWRRILRPTGGFPG